MADVKILAPFLLSWEGGFVNDPKDKGGATNKGVTLKTWRSVGYDIDADGDIDVQDLKLLTDDDVIEKVLKPHYWDKVGGDKIKDQGVANMLADWAYMSGTKTPATKVQRLVGAVQDGVIGPRTIALINAYRGQQLFEDLKRERARFYGAIVKKYPGQKRFLNGWLARLDCMHYDWLRCNGGKAVRW